MKTGRKITALINRRPGITLGLIIALPIALWLLWGLFGVDLVLSFWDRPGGVERVARLGQTGDLFGGINALFAAYAFAGVAIAAYFQYQSLQVLQQQQVQQSFEPLFFRLLELSRTHKPERLKMESSGRPFVDAIESLASKIESQLNVVDVPFGEEMARSCTSSVYSNFYETNEQALGPYFRSLYHLFRKIDSSDLHQVQQEHYASIARATLGSDDLFLLMVNCAVPKNCDFRRLVEEYGLLKHMAVTGEISHRLRMTTKLVPVLYSPTAQMSAIQRDDYRFDRLSNIQP